jgi:hypothetical protein
MVDNTILSKSRLGFDWSMDKEWDDNISGFLFRTIAILVLQLHYL